jgi:hypothetical protein
MTNRRMLTGAAACLLALTALSAATMASAGDSGGQAPLAHYHLDHAPKASSCAAITSPYGTAKSLLRACGYTIYPLRRVIKNADGSTTYLYRVAGHKVTSVAPPAGFNPLKATNRQLAKYGLPTRSALGARAWRKLMSHFSYAVPHGYLVAGPPTMRLANCRFCWSGYQDQNHSNYFEAIASYNEPHTTAGRCSAPRLEGVWVGVGDEKSTIGQSGTTAGSEHNHQSFWEVIGPNFPGPPMFGRRAKVGDKVTAFTTYPLGEGAYTFTVMDKSKVILQNNFFTSVYQGKFALFIVEDPQLGSTHPHIPAFGKITFSNARAARINGHLARLGSFPHKRLTMTDTAHHPMAATSKLSNNNKFTVTYHRCS